jgi:hypothetical protein
MLSPFSFLIGESTKTKESFPIEAAHENGTKHRQLSLVTVF